MAEGGRSQKTSAPCCYGTEVNIHFRGTTHICVKKRTLRRQTAPFPLTRARRRGLLCPKGGSACGSGTTFPRRLGSTSTNRALSMPLHRDTPALHSLYTRDIIRSPLPFCQEQKKGRLPFWQTALERASGFAPLSLAGKASGLKVSPHPLGLEVGFEPTTYALRMRCSTD